MENPFKSGLWIVYTIIVIIGTGIGIWQYLKPSYKLEAYILSTKAPLPPKVIDDLNKMVVLSPEEIRKGYKEDPEMKDFSDTALKKAISFFSKILKHRLDLIIGASPIFREEYLTVITIYNFGDQTITGVELKTGFSFKGIAQLERDDGKQETLEFSGKLAIGNLAPLSKVVVYSYSMVPTLDQYFITLTHDKGVGKISSLQPVPRLVTETRGVWISFYWSTIVLACIVAAILLVFAVYWLRRRWRLKG